MRTKSLLHGLLAVILSFASLSALIAPNALAVTEHIWDGGGNDDNFTTAANWETDAAPSSGDSIKFPELGSDFDVIIDTDFTIGGLSFDCNPTPAKGYTISGTHTLTVSGSITNDCDGTTISAPLDTSYNIGISNSFNTSALTIANFSTSATYHEFDGHVHVTALTVASGGTRTLTNDYASALPITTLTINGATTLEGPFNVTNLEANANVTFGSGTYGTIAALTTAGGTRTITNNDDANLQVAALTANNNVTFAGTGDISVTALTAASGATRTLTNNVVGHSISVGTLTANGAISLAGTSSYDIATMAGSGNATIANDTTLTNVRPTYTGQIIVANGGHLRAAHDAFDERGTGSTGSTAVADGGTLTLSCDNDRNVSIAEPIGLAGDGIEGSTVGALVINGGDFSYLNSHCHMTVASLTMIADATMVLNSYSETTVTTFTNTGNHTLSLAQGKTGTLILPGLPAQKPAPLVDTYAGDSPAVDLTVTDNNVAVVTGTRGDITVNYGGTLKGTGTVADVTVNDGAIAPGLSPGTLNTGDIIYTGGTLQEEIGGTASGSFDQLNVTGTVNLGQGVTSLVITHYNNFAPKLNDSFVIIANDGQDAVTGTFAGLAQGGTVVVAGYTYTISYTGGTGNDVVLTVTGLPPAAPDTGFSLTKATPVISILAGLLAATGLGLLAKRQSIKIKSNR